MTSWSKSLHYFDVEPRATPTLRDRCLRTLSIVAGCWSLFATGLMWFCLNHVGSPFAAKLRILAFCALTVSAGIFSVILPLSYVLREPAHKK